MRISQRLRREERKRKERRIDGGTEEWGEEDGGTKAVYVVAARGISVVPAGLVSFFDRRIENHVEGGDCIRGTGVWRARGLIQCE